ncbi:MAG TPA: DNA-3-methyladenine glycosylase [Gemmatimonadales bacterium]|nr:DNA-3-methyladenine glycosylase [Gemmatimonadales bacterium]
MSRIRRAAPLPVAFFRRQTIEVARELLGARVVSNVRGVRTEGRIVEVEAYLGAKDPASHAYAYRRHRQNESLYGPIGSWYVYLSYGMHWCANLVAGPPGEGSAILIRALEPLEGLPVMRRRRGNVPDRALCSGPGRLTQAMGITRALDGLSMPKAPIMILADEPPSEGTIATTTRIGLTKAADWPLRFAIRGSPWTSGPRIR